MIGNIVDLVRQRGGLILANEVTTGVGRTGKWFGYQHYDFLPDMVSIGKGIGNGYPVSVAVISSAVFEKLQQVPFKYSQSHQNDPLAAAVVSEVIKIIEQSDLINKARSKGDRFLCQLEVLKHSELVQDVRGRGLMFALDLANKEVGDEIYQALIERGYIVCNRSGLFRIDPALVITEDEFDEFVKVLTEVVENSEKAVKRKNGNE